jgi:hypothetical protein
MTFRYLLVHACVPRLLTLARLILVAQFFIWRVTHRDSDSMLLWWVTVVGDFWFAVTWLLNQASKLNPVKRVPDLALLQRHFRDAQLPGLNVFINTVDPGRRARALHHELRPVHPRHRLPGRPARHVPLRRRRVARPLQGVAGDRRAVDALLPKYYHPNIIIDYH